jgi:hypothetical protein
VMATAMVASTATSIPATAGCTWCTGGRPLVEGRPIDADPALVVLGGCAVVRGVVGGAVVDDARGGPGEHVPLDPPRQAGRILAAVASGGEDRVGERATGRSTPEAQPHRRGRSARPALVVPPCSASPRQRRTCAAGGRARTRTRRRRARRRPPPRRRAPAARRGRAPGDSRGSASPATPARTSRPERRRRA